MSDPKPAISLRLARRPPPTGSSDRDVYRRLADLADASDLGITDPAEMRAQARTWVRELRAWADRVEQAMPADWREGDADADRALLAAIDEEREREWSEP